MCERKSVYVLRGGEESPPLRLPRGGVSLRVLIYDEEEGGVRGRPELEDNDLQLHISFCISMGGVSCDIQVVNLQKIRVRV